VALVGNGQIYQISLKAGEEYVVHPSNVVAYTATQYLPTPYRFKSTTLNFQIPGLTGWFPQTKFFEEMRKTGTWKGIASAAFRVRTWARRGIWGDRVRLFCLFRGRDYVLG
jgi:hypothetical protein